MAIHLNVILARRLIELETFAGTGYNLELYLERRAATVQG